MSNAQAATSVPSARAAPRADRYVRPLAWSLLALALFALVLLAHGLLPGLSNSATLTWLGEGSTNCLHDLGLHALTTRCHEFGEPLGYPLLTWGPVIGLAALLMHLPGLEGQGALTLAGAVFDGLALAGGYGLMRRLGAGPLIALGTATVYLLSPTVVGMAPFSGTLPGFALLPAYAFVELLVMGAVERRGARMLALVLAGYVAVRTGAIFMDGYSFMASNLVALALWATWLIRSELPAARKWLGVGLFLAANAIAAGIYLLYVPASYEQNPIGIFRAMGLDLSTLVLPSKGIWFASALHVTSDPRDLWGDSSNSVYNYVGIVTVGLALAYLVWRPRQAFAVAIAVAGLAALVLAFGPSLKLHDVKPAASIDRGAQPSRQNQGQYEMPTGVAALDLPWGGLFTHVPGVDQMRAPYRWFAVTRFALIILAGLALARMARQRDRRRLFAIALAVLAVVELMPNLPLLVDQYRDSDRDMDSLRADVDGDLRAATHPGERAFFLSYDGDHNDYLAGHLASVANLRAYNAGGDKNATMSAQHWPVDVRAMAQRDVSHDIVAQALYDRQVDVVIAPFFHLRWASYAWPPDPSLTARAKATFAPILSDPRLAVEQHAWFATVRLPG